jgi:hypothetical protein
MPLIRAPSRWSIAGLMSGGRRQWSWPRRRSAAFMRTTPIRRFPLGQPGDRDQCDRGVAAHPRREIAVSRLLLHLSAPRATTDAGELPLRRPARADQRMVCDRQDRRPQTVSGLPPAAWLRFRVGHADKSVRPQRQFRPAFSYVSPALLAKIDAAVQDSRETVEIWGTGRPRREFLHVDDLTDVVVFLMKT